MQIRASALLEMHCTAEFLVLRMGVTEEGPLVYANLRN